MRARKNETTGRILALLAGKRSAKVREIAGKLKLDPKNIAATLKRLTRQGHVTRVKVEDGEVVIDKEEDITRANWCYDYTITEKGQERLQRIAGGQE